MVELSKSIDEFIQLISIVIVSEVLVSHSDHVNKHTKYIGEYHHAKQHHRRTKSSFNIRFWIEISKAHSGQSCTGKVEHLNHNLVSA